MSVVIRMARCGRRNLPRFRVVAACKEKPRDGQFIEVLVTYDPKDKSQKLKIDKDRVEYWRGKGAVPSETIANLLKTMR